MVTQLVSKHSEGLNPSHLAPKSTILTTGDCVGPTQTPGAVSRQVQPQGLFLASTAPGRAGLRPRPHLPPTPRADSAQVPGAFVATQPWLHFALPSDPALLSLWTGQRAGCLQNDPRLVLSLSRLWCPHYSKRILLKHKSDRAPPLLGSSRGSSHRIFILAKFSPGPS